ncbi:hypothetical protein QA641_36765 [Bradyrhizobium sp. CB1650]|uniref:hypothetical protein n=1 Tax=Bradyrhizobium sp. CB1650 TaxID=3039153 RepID=UPI002435D8AC|nr:hypothetical protein [Bradyrhizobium sp. CB1650]WGD51058.1 hypothetical protein QA641_36765 [Bradyrhizobium sp. CB1650]
MNTITQMRFRLIYRIHGRHITSLPDVRTYQVRPSGHSRHRTIISGQVAFMLRQSNGYGAASNERERPHDSVSDALASIGRSLDFYNRTSEHPSVYIVVISGSVALVRR